MHIRTAAAVGGFAILSLLFGLKILAFPEGLFPIDLPDRFWYLLSLVVVLGYLAHHMMTHPAPRPAPRSLSIDPTPIVTGATVESPPSAPESEPYYLRGVEEAPPAGAVAASRTDSEISKLINWLDGVRVQISEWTGGVAGTSEPEPPAEEPKSTMTTRPAGPARTGAWTDHRARTAIEKFLRTRPWAPASDIARALHMDVGLATRVSETLRDPGRN